MIGIDTPLGSRKRRGQIVDVVLGREGQILVGVVVQRVADDRRIREVHALAIAQRAAAIDAAVDHRVLHAQHGELDLAVVDQHPHAGLDQAPEALVADRDTLGVAHPALTVQREGGAGDQDGAAPRDVPGANLDAAGIHHDGHVGAELVDDLADSIQSPAVVLGRAVGEVQAGDVHACLDHLLEDLGRIAGRPYGGDQLGLAGPHAGSASICPGASCAGLGGSRIELPRHDVVKRSGPRRSSGYLRNCLKSGLRFCMKAVMASMFSGEPAWRSMAASSTSRAASMPAR
jgi:hypothetical protein